MKIFLIIFPIFLFSQTFQRDINPFPVILFEDELLAPFIGGFNKPNPRFLDWNEDGVIDLFIRDEDGFLQYFKNIGSASNPEFQFQTKAFQGLYVGIWFSFLDFDFDGDADLLCQTSGSYYISAYENISGEFQLRTEQLLDDIGDPVFGSQADIPTLSDIDGDNLEDLFMGNQAGKVIYYSNIGTSDGLPVFQYITNYFQHINIIWFPPGRDSRHGASALEFFDINGDDTQDLFWGDLFQPSLFFLENIGTPQVPEIPDSLMFTSYPEEYPIVSAGFNAPRFADLDNDGDSELVVGVQTGQYGTDNIDNFWYYKNNGTSAEPQFNFETKNFIPTLDLFSNSVPTFIDIDNDNDLDLFVGNELDPPTWSGAVYYFENTGDSNNPSFMLEDTSYFGGNLGNNLAPAFADIDGDGDEDGFVGDWNGKIFYFENTGSPTQPSFANSVELLNIDLSGYSTPIFGDIDQDNDFDLFVGDKNGKIHFWENIGSATDPQFSDENNDYFPEFNLGENIIPSLYDYENDGDLDFFIGNKTGQLFLIKNNAESFEYEELTNFPYSGINIAPEVVDIDSDGNPDLFVGSRTGGLQYFQINSDLENISIDYLLGWNLIGLPADVEDPYYLSIFPDAIVNTLYSFDITYNPASILVPGDGYWLMFQEAGTATIVGTPINELTINLNTGWNFISGTAEAVSIYSVIDPDSIIIPGTLYGFDGAYIVSDMFFPGSGYWLKTFEAGDITLTSGALAKTAPRDFSLKDRANTLSISGIDLYFGVEMSARDRLSYSLPPKPPSGAFDLRFRGDTRIAGENTEIEVMSPFKRLTVSYDVIIDAGEKMNWVLTSKNGNEYPLEGTGEITIPSAERFTLERKAVIPLAFTLHPNYPNPFNPITTFYYDLPKRAHVTLIIYDLLGRPVKVLVNTKIENGTYQVTWNGSDDSGKMVSAGIYLCVLKSNAYAQTRKMILLK